MSEFYFPVTRFVLGESWNTDLSTTATIAAKLSSAAIQVARELLTLFESFRMISLPICCELATHGQYPATSTTRRDNKTATGEGAERK